MMNYYYVRRPFCKSTNFSLDAFCETRILSYHSSKSLKSWLRYRENMFVWDVLGIISTSLGAPGKNTFPPCKENKDFEQLLIQISGKMAEI